MLKDKVRSDSIQGCSLLQVDEQAFDINREYLAFATHLANPSQKVTQSWLCQG
jgi:hypothetical protein